MQQQQENLNSNALSWTGGAKGDTPQFPAKYLPQQRDADTRVELKKLLAQSGQPFGQVIATEEDMKYLLEKRKLGDRILFDTWFSRLFDTKDINKLRIAQQIHPEYFQMREEEINREAEVQKKIAKLRLRGPADLSDLQMVFALQNGQVKLRPTPLWALDVADSSTQAAQYQRGIFNPTRFFTNASAQSVPEFTGTGMIDTSGRVDPLNSGIGGSYGSLLDTTGYAGYTTMS